ncbi:FecR domain-containing protein [Sphingobium sp. LMA1-1-1.1]|uniref:FecR family protein n=1 Tax=Sphingobium sp. LMA1-1-1.1 TaxID=3135238 RepID=UPI0034347D6C
MTDAVRAIPRSIRDAAGDWLARRREPARPDVERAFAVWMDADPRHRIAYQQAERDWQHSRLLADRDVGRTRKLVRAPFLMRHSTHVAAASLGVVVLLGIGGVGLLRYGSPLELVSPAQAATYETALGEIRTISLADGSQLTLDTATRVRVTLSASERKVSLERGRARFRVAPDGKRPFTVTVPGGNVVSRSRLFDVSVERGSPVVAVIEGRVDLTSTSDAASHPARTLAAGQTADLGNADAPRPTSPAETQWVSGMLALDGGPLGEAVAAINRYNRIQIRLAEPELARLSVTGAFQVRNPDAFARAVAATFGLGIDRTDPGVILLRRAS